jgi:hypothetical protein
VTRAHPEPAAAHQAQATLRPDTAWRVAAALAAAVVALGSCGRDDAGAVKASAAPPPPLPAPVEPTPMPDVVAPKAGQNVVARSSESIARGAPEPPCRDCDKADGASAPVYNQQPDMQLDDQTLADTRATIEATSALLERGVEILESHVDRPEKAAAALRKWLTKHDKEVQKTFADARDIRSRLAAAGYVQDIPHELQAPFAERMEAIQKRLEKMREVYRDQLDALEAFGAFFPRLDAPSAPEGAAKPATK